MANEIRLIKPEAKRNERIEKAIRELSQTNKRFDREKFRAACTPGKDPANVSTVAPLEGVTYRHRVQVDTGAWFDREKDNQFDELYAVTYDGVRYVFDECRYSREYSKNHVWAGQVESRGIDIRHVFEQFVGRKPEYNCGKNSGSYQPDMELKDFLADFLFNVHHAEDIESCTAYDCVMTYDVEPENIEAFERDLNKIASVIKACKFEYEKDQPPSDE